MRLSKFFASSAILFALSGCCDDKIKDIGGAAALDPQGFIAAHLSGLPTDNETMDALVLVLKWEDFCFDTCLKNPDGTPKQLCGSPEGNEAFRIACSSLYGKITSVFYHLHPNSTINLRSPDPCEQRATLSAQLHNQRISVPTPQTKTGATPIE